MSEQVVFRTTFWTPTEEYERHNGKRFEVLETLTGAEENAEGELSDMYKIRLDTGELVTAFQEEVVAGIAVTVGGVPFVT